MTLPCPVVAIDLDGLEVSLAEQLMAAGKMPMLSAVQRRSPLPAPKATKVVVPTVVKLLGHERASSLSG